MRIITSHMRAHTHTHTYTKVEQKNVCMFVSHHKAVVESECSSRTTNASLEDCSAKDTRFCRTTCCRQTMLGSEVRHTLLTAETKPAQDCVGRTSSEHQEHLEKYCWWPAMTASKHNPTCSPYGQHFNGVARRYPQ